eukprot:CAMPEP_0197577806 /NCGR_PEP_ID=MMETSP1326-20131121/2296_1 /TAXON_ID=1155430 /ORGANISM="Genus nov. species nov., Strain RCC2288" /LENGTH=268 /DNA_ID=CAMNT_0043140925 /DNA_START=258 /DNA_END=1061 /DNA_ORIENTATION=-
MREYEIETTFDVPLETFLRVVYGDDGFFFRRYHADAGDDPAASVPPWDLSDGTRVVTFCKTMALPSVIERLLGSAASTTLRFEEKQWFRYDPANGMACVRSTPTLVSPAAGDSFKTEVTVYLAPFGDDRSRCSMRAKLSVAAEGTWALQPLVEKMMEHRASATFREWVRYADTFLTDNYAGELNAERPLPKLGVLGAAITKAGGGRRHAYAINGEGDNNGTSNGNGGAEEEEGERGGGDGDAEGGFDDDSASANEGGLEVFHEASDFD